MKLDIGSLMFNINVKVGGTPSWGTEMGQGEGYKFHAENIESLITSLTYKSVDDIENVVCEFGKGGSRTNDYRIMMASVYNKVYVNNELIPNAEFLLIMAKQIINPNGFHIGRKTLKYSPNMTYRNVKINEKCFELIRKKYNLNENSAWFINEINTKNQDELYLTMYIIDKEKELFFESALERKKYIQEIEKNQEELKLKELNKNRIKGGYNKIYYGVPGTGKSYGIKKKLENVEEENKFRTTFHPEYTYNDFVGQLLPMVIKEGVNKGNITYGFQKGPFTLALEKAYNTPEKEVYLVIEEMSRGNCAAIFGDIFQLLDREKSGEEKDWSVFSVNNEVIAQDIMQINNGKIKIPSNLFILGTINTSDQNVFVVDNAFKRRFDWEYISTKPISENGKYLNNAQLEFNNGNENIHIDWINLYRILNKFISSTEKLALGEDKQIGQFFIEFNGENNKEKIKNKLLHYLWFDIQTATYKTEVKLFDKSIANFSDLYEKYEQEKKIFSDEFFEYIKEWYNNNL